MIYTNEDKYQPIIDEAVHFWKIRGYDTDLLNIRVNFSISRGEHFVAGSLVAGVAYKDYVTINVPMIRDNGFTLMNVVAHEIGHTMNRVDNSDPTSIMNGDTSVISKHPLVWYNE